MSRKKLFLSLFKKLSIERLANIDSTIEEDNKIPSIEEMNDSINSSIVDNELYSSKYDYFIQIENYIEKNNLNYLTYFDDKFPQKLREIAQAPRLLYYKGNLDNIGALSIAIVGTRKPSNYGIWAANKFSKELASNGFCVISGMASGIDKFAHQGALESDGKTICVLGSSITKPYPKTNSKLMQSVIDSGGLVISEYSDLSPIIPANFAYRNRIVSGLSDGILIIEAGMKSGTLITADFGLEQGKNIFAVPGSIDSVSSIGTNNLIKQGAQLVTCVNDILEAYGMDYGNVVTGSKDMSSLSEIERTIYGCIQSKGICTPDMISIHTSLNIKDVTGILNILDIKSFINYDGHIASIKT